MKWQPSQRPKDHYLQSKNKNFAWKKSRNVPILKGKEKSRIAFPHKCMTAESTEYRIDSIIVRKNGIALVLFNVLH